MQPAVIFDLDGVLVDSFTALLDAWKIMTLAEGLSFDEPCGFLQSVTSKTSPDNSARETKN